MAGRRSYDSPTAFRRALTDRLKTIAETSRWALPELQRQFAYDRLLERLYLLDQDWIVKGATALLARNFAVRATIDIDVYRNSTYEDSERELRTALAQDIGDWFRFEAKPARNVSGSTKGARIPIHAYIGTTPWAQFHVDLVGAEVTMTGVPDAVPPLARVAMPDVEQHGYRAYPLVDHVADKVAATFQRYGEAEAPSTRYKDLIDLVAITTQASVDAQAQKAALASEAQRRHIALPPRFDVPDPDLWKRGYAGEIRRSLLPIAPTLDDALTIVKSFLDPLLDGSASGHWNPKTLTWVA